MSRIGIAAVTIALAACGGGNNAPATHFTASLKASNEPNNPSSPATGSATYDIIGSVGYTNTGATVAYTITFSGLTSPVTNGHIHVGAAGVNGPVVVPFTTKIQALPAGSTGGTISGTFSASDVLAGTSGSTSVAAGSLDDLFAAMRAGNTYTNIHSQTNPNGEIRAQNQ
jgi:CHRD domain